MRRADGTRCIQEDLLYPASRTGTKTADEIFQGERGALLYSLIGTCKLNGVDPESYLRHVLDLIADWPVNRVSELLPWRVALPTE